MTLAGAVQARVRVVREAAGPGFPAQIEVDFFTR
jgi:hypothetical protein